MKFDRINVNQVGLTWSGRELLSSRRGDLTVLDLSSDSVRIME